MKNLNLALSLLLSVAVVVLYVLHFSPKDSTATAKSSVSSTASSTSKIAYITMDSVLKNYKYYLEASAIFDKQRAEAEKELERRARKLQNEVDEYRSKAQAGLLSQNEMKGTEEKLMRQQQELQYYNQSETDKLMREEQVQMEKLYERITNFLKTYNADNRYDYIINYAKGTNVWYGNPAFDITTEVVEGLNKAFEEEVKGKK